ncbi:unknown [Spodoptera litura nucleopolyhedrovirus]|uniref:Uncharacterized protein n=1 Tax=Spodoptera litura multicapsid nucleopolyhedrovirus TaxID=46242 RepID=Q91BL0_NPVST|nr:hypothetical protein [Spodoptera litura nucleopolyhedrovirus]AAL01823.1 unknown [Spodoptera litura nucleopolyhedrovirus]QHN73855.1 hypothetical protein [Spodoptera litura nucleopolyhedrovirus]WOC30870.1 hypothetical protein GACBDANE_00123 [Spodoptera litura nucleopolyhedrovirus]
MTVCASVLSSPDLDINFFCSAKKFGYRQDAIYSTKIRIVDYLSSKVYTVYIDSIYYEIEYIFALQKS